MIKVIAFDLDDTLLDTTHILVPMASRRTYDLLKPLHPKMSFAQFDQERQELSKSFSHREIFQKIMTQQGFQSSTDQRLALKATEDFYNNPIPASLPLLEGALENLKILSKKYILYLVTSGSPATQSAKVKSCAIENYFKKCYFMDGMKGERKGTAFKEILDTTKVNPKDLLSIGNRLYQEIREAKKCGSQTCYFKYGEHVGEVPQVPEDHPDFTVQHHRELLQICHL